MMLLWTLWHPGILVCLISFTQRVPEHTLAVAYLHTHASFNHSVLACAPKVKWGSVRAHRIQVTSSSSYFNPYHHILRKGPWGCYRSHFIVLFLPSLKTRCDLWTKCLVNRKFMLFCLLNPYISLEVLLHSWCPMPLYSNVSKAE